MNHVILTLHPIPWPLPTTGEFEITAGPGARVLQLVGNSFLLVVEDAMPPEGPPIKMKFSLVAPDVPVEWDWANSRVLGVIEDQGSLRCLLQVYL